MRCHDAIEMDKVRGMAMKYLFFVERDQVSDPKNVHFILRSKSVR